MKLKDIKALKVEADKLPTDSIEHIKLMMEYHSEYSEHWDSKICTVYNDDEKCTKEWQKHLDRLDEYHRKYRTLQGL